MLTSVLLLTLRCMVENREVNELKYELEDPFNAAVKYFVTTSLTCTTCELVLWHIINNILFYFTANTGSLSRILSESSKITGTAVPVHTMKV
jgi:hypothetical protein